MGYGSVEIPSIQFTFRPSVHVHERVSTRSGLPLLERPTRPAYRTADIRLARPCPVTRNRDDPGKRETLSSTTQQHSSRRWPHLLYVAALGLPNFSTAQSIHHQSLRRSTCSSARARLHSRLARLSLHHLVLPLSSTLTKAIFKLKSGAIAPQPLARLQSPGSLVLNPAPLIR